MLGFGIIFILDSASPWSSSACGLPKILRSPIFSLYLIGYFMKQIDNSDAFDLLNFSTIIKIRWVRMSNMPENERQGYLGNLANKPRSELLDLLNRQTNLLENRYPILFD